MYVALFDAKLTLWHLQFFHCSHFPSLRFISCVCFFCCCYFKLLSFDLNDSALLNPGISQTRVAVLHSSTCPLFRLDRDVMRSAGWLFVVATLVSCGWEQWFSNCGEGNTGATVFLSGHAFEVHIMILFHLDFGCDLWTLESFCFRSRSDLVWSDYEV